MKSISDILSNLFTNKGVSYTNLSSDSFQERIHTLPVVLIDVRTPEEYSLGHIPGAKNEDYYSGDFLRNVQNSVGTDTPLAIYCRSGKRSEGAAKILSAAGYKVYNLAGGILEWEKESLPLETNSQQIQ